MDILITIIFTMFLIFVMPINVRVIYDKNNSKVELRLVKIFNIKFSVGKVLRYFVTTKRNRDEITLDGIIYNLTIFIKSKDIIRLVCRLAKVKKVTVSAGIDYEHYLLVVNLWMAVSRLKIFLRHTFYKVENEHYLINNSDELYFGTELIIETRIILLLIAIIIKIKDLFKVIKFMRLYYGKSNI